MGQVSSFYFPVLCLGYRPLPASPLCRIPPYSTEMNPIEQICKQFCSMGFRNEVFKTLKCVVDRLCMYIYPQNHLQNAWQCCCQTVD